MDLDQGYGFVNLIRLIPAPIKRFAAKLLPARAVSRLRETLSGNDYTPWMVSRENPLITSFRRRVSGKNPHLHRIVVHLTDHCNLNCRGCTHFSNIAKPAFADVDQFEREFEQLARTFSGITEIYLLGGEPLLHPEVARFLPIARRAFPESRINLMSNGILVPRMGHGFWTAMRENSIHLVCDLYPVGLDIQAIERLTSEHGVELEWTDPREDFFKLPIDLTGSQDAEESFRACGGVNNCVIVRDGRLYPCAYVAYSDIFAGRFGIEGMEPTEADSISLFEGHHPYEIYDFLCDPVPWCRFCDVESVSTYQWERSKRTIDEWVDAPRGNDP